MCGFIAAHSAGRACWSDEPDRLVLALVPERLPERERGCGIDRVAAGHVGTAERLHGEERLRLASDGAEHVVRRE